MIEVDKTYLKRPESGEAGKWHRRAGAVLVSPPEFKGPVTLQGRERGTEHKAKGWRSGRRTRGSVLLAVLSVWLLFPSKRRGWRVWRAEQAGWQLLAEPVWMPFTKGLCTHAADSFLSTECSRDATLMSSTETDFWTFSRYFWAPPIYEYCDFFANIPSEGMVYFISE